MQEFKLAQMQGRLKNEELVQLLDKVIGSDSHNIELQIERIRLLGEGGATTRALTLAMVLREEHPNNPELLHELGNLSEKAGNYEVASELQLKALELATEMPVLPFAMVPLIV